MLLIVSLSLLALAQARPEPVHVEAPRPELYFDWEDCGQHPLRPLKIHSLSITPDPVKLPGTAYLSFDVESTAEISNMDVKVTLKKKTLIGEIKVPCIGGVGSCTYKDLCSYVDKLPGQPITCPVAPARVTKTNLEVPLPDPGSIGGLLGGRFSLQTYFTETSTGLEMGCFKMTIRLKA